MAYIVFISLQRPDEVITAVSCTFFGFTDSNRGDDVRLSSVIKSKLDVDSESILFSSIVSKESKIVDEEVVLLDVELLSIRYAVSNSSSLITLLFSAAKLIDLAVVPNLKIRSFLSKIL